ncbi:hypothetical protein [Paenibacillus abyssi]|uniref:Helicase XPB/Ssl2 N-terminal domain-containing protein n=1 Tax=Paenibacillus abyssi TaxID=1340531 RepID=A0A917CIW8_9BACL|nr:hypothetical protein [Paenibacillus abyssi]GGF88898.1 hypothetical protein GCM10010916_02770 [Paenibacillus abyssi]
MNLAEMLGYADIGQLNRIAAAYQCNCNSHSKNELIQSILRAINSKEVFKHQIRSMRMEELRFLSSLLFDSQNAYSLEELIARVQQSRFELRPESMPGERTSEVPPVPERAASRKGKPAAAESPRDTIVKFKHAGWLFNGFSGTNRYLFHIPNDLKQRFCDELERQFEEGLHFIMEPDGFRDEQNLLSEDVLSLLDHIYQNEVLLSAEGSMYKRTIQQVLERFHVLEELPLKGAWRFGYGRRIKDYPNRMSLIYDYCYYNGLIAENGNSLCLTSAGDEFREQRKRAEPTQLYRFWLRLYKGAIPNLLSLVNWVDRLSDRWVTISSLGNTLIPFIKPYYYDSAEAIFEQRILGMMMHLGLIRIGEKHGAGQVIRMTKVGRAVVAGVYVADHDRIQLD